MSILHDEYYAKWRMSNEQPMDAKSGQHDVIRHKGITYFKNRSDLEAAIAEWNDSVEYIGHLQQNDVVFHFLYGDDPELDEREIDLDEIIEKTVNENTVYAVEYVLFNDSAAQPSTFD